LSAYLYIFVAISTLTIAHLQYGRIAAKRRPGFPLQFLSLPAVGLRDFRFNPLRG
jgi:hypothetical protein